jgi:hypothetical protein
VLVLLAFTGIRWYQHTKANHMVRDCRNIWLACRTTATDFYGNDKVFLDGSTESGLTAAAELEVQKLSGTSEEFKVVKWDSDQGAPGEIVYYSDPYELHFYYESGVRYWEVYRKSKILSLEAEVG